MKDILLHDDPAQIFNHNCRKKSGVPKCGTWTKQRKMEVEVKRMTCVKRAPQKTLMSARQCSPIGKKLVLKTH